MTPTITNLHRAAWARLALSTFVRETENGTTLSQLGNEDLSAAIADLISDLLHLALLGKLDPKYIIEQAQANFAAELSEEA
jgi:hypothetical protein